MEGEAIFLELKAGDQINRLIYDNIHNFFVKSYVVGTH